MLKPGRKSPAIILGPRVGQLPGAGGAAADGGEGLLEVEAVAGGEAEGLAGGEVGEADEDLVDEFGELAVAAGAAVGEGFAIGGEEGADAVEGRFVRRRP